MRNMKLSFPKLFTLLLSVTALLAGMGCGKAEMSERRLSMDMVGYNHTALGIGNFDVQVLPGGRGVGGYLAAGAGGGGAVCCIAVPEKWHPGLVAHVNALTGDNTGGKDQRSWDVPVPQYTPEQAGHFSVHFLRNGNVKVFVTKLALWHKDYPLQGKDADLKPGSN